MSDQMEIDGDACPADEQPSGSQAKAVVAVGSVVATAATTASVTVSLHPLVIMNISEHWTRIRAQKGFKQQGKNIFIIFRYSLYIWFFLVIGALIGKQTGRHIEVMNSFELRFEIVDQTIIINQDYYNTKEQQCKFCLVSTVTMQYYILHHSQFYR